ncbi:hypothetical protein Tco_0871499 [Tanacetum coccineum]
MVFNSPCLTDKKELIHHEVRSVLKWLQFTIYKPLMEPKDWLVLEANDIGVLMHNKDIASSRGQKLIYSEFPSNSSQDSTDDVVAKFIFQSSRFQD